MGWRGEVVTPQPQGARGSPPPRHRCPPCQLPLPHDGWFPSVAAAPHHMGWSRSSVTTRHSSLLHMACTSPPPPSGRRPVLSLRAGRVGTARQRDRPTGAWQPLFTPLVRPLVLMERWPPRPLLGSPWRSFAWAIRGARRHWRAPSLPPPGDPHGRLPPARPAPSARKCFCAQAREHQPRTMIRPGLPAPQPSTAPSHRRRKLEGHATRTRGKKKRRRETPGCILLPFFAVPPAASRPSARSAVSTRKGGWNCTRPRSASVARGTSHPPCGGQNSDILCLTRAGA